MTLKKVLLSFMVMLLSFQTRAISIYEGKIKALLAGPNYNSILYIQIDRSVGSITDEVAECDNPNWDYIIDTSTDNGEFYASLALAAYMGDKTVNIQGYDDCSGNMEILRHIWLK